MGEPREERDEREEGAAEGAQAQAAETHPDPLTGVFTIKAGRLPGRIETYSMYNGFNTVAHALQTAGLSGANIRDVRLDGRSTSMDSEIREGSEVLVLQPIRGN